MITSVNKAQTSLYSFEVADTKYVCIELQVNWNKPKKAKQLSSIADLFYITPLGIQKIENFQI